MQLVHISIDIKFEENAELYTPARKVFTALGGKIPKTLPREPYVSIRREKLKALVNWRYNGCRITLERTENRNECVNLAVQFLETIDSVVRIGNMQRVDVNTNWILPTPRHNFASLNELYMQTLMSQKKFMEGTFDSSVILDGRIDDLILSHQSGPMEPKQLVEEFLVFKREALPKLFIFLSIEISHRNVLEYSKVKMRSFLEECLSHCERHSEDFGKIWEGYL